MVAREIPWLSRCSSNHIQAARLFFSLTPAKSDARKSTSILRRNSLAVHPSVIKRHRQSIKKRTRNIDSRSRIRTLIKKARQAIDAKNQETAAVQLRAVDKALGKAVNKGIIKRNTASRWLSRLSRSASRINSPSS
ncbi:MAG: 30S ribosomal protein S20 [Alphaproteobacteria bacterium]